MNKVNDGRVLPLLLWLGALASVLLVVQIGHPYDEAEHGHIAWLMGKIGQRPLDDFFQHHMPLLWDILKIYFLLGFDGPEVLYFGRFLVVVSMLILGVGWLLTARLLTSRRVDANYATAVVIGAFTLLFLMRPDIIVIRPESLAAAPWLLSCLCWRYASQRSPNQDKHFFGSGALYCAALCFSPRMLFLIGWLALLSVGRPSLKQGALWVLGAVSFWLAYFSVCGCSLRYWYFAPYYSSLLQKIGGWDTTSILPYYYSPSIVALAVLWGVLFWMSTPQSRSASWVHLGYLALTFGIGWGSSYPHHYLQNFTPSYLCVSFSLLWLASQVQWEDHPVVRMLIQCGLGVLCLWLVGQTRIFLDKDLTLVNMLEVRRHVLSYLSPSDSVLMSYQIHPIVARDASYYGPWLADSQSRMPEAVAGVQERFALPACNYFEDLKAGRPRLVDTDVDLAVHVNEGPDLRQYLATHYDTLLWRRRGIPLLLLRRESGAALPY